MTEVIVWTGWLGGIAVGSYALFQFLLTGNSLGVSSGYANICGFVSNASFFRDSDLGPPNSWRLWFIIGLPLGGFLAAATSPGPIIPSFSLGQLYDSVIPNNLWARGLVLMLGGAMIGFGARMAGGCTSGHAIAGMSKLNAPSMLAAMGFFLGGIIMVQMLFNLLS
ncbi:YeeE/YedE family protein [bacterium]|nr:YeeE/YedE family protein [bacterium]